MIEIPSETFLARLKPENPGHTDLEFFIRRRVEHGEMRIARKDSSLVQTIQEFKRLELAPVIDKRFRTVFGLMSGHHETLRGVLYNYHQETLITNLENAAQYYMSEGCGYYLSSMNWRFIIAGARYTPDKLDEELFSLHKVMLI